MKKIVLILCIFCAACSKKESLKKPSNDFESLMGKDLPAWEYVQTKDDFENLAFFKNVFEKNLVFLNQAQQESRIPKVIHFIWIGPKPFPRESIENVRTWVAHHPDWTMKFWTDRERPLPHPSMQKIMIQNFKFLELGKFYNLSDNYAEKSDILRMEILHQEGGVYADHDVKCLKSFDTLNAAFDLYCGMEVPYKTALYSTVLPTNNILGSKPQHLILKHCMDWLAANWDQLEKDYPGQDRDSVINRISHRTFFVLGEMFKKYANLEGNRDIALPSYYFNSPKVEWAIYSQHQYKGTWFEGESKFEKMARERLMMLSKKTNKLFLVLAVMSGLNLMGFVAILFHLRKKPRHEKKEQSSMD